MKIEKFKIRTDGIVFFVLFLVFTGYSQGEESKRSIRFGLQFSPEISRRFQKEVITDAQTLNYIDHHYGSKNRSVLVFVIGCSVEKQVSNRIECRTGLKMFTTGQKGYINPAPISMNQLILQKGHMKMGTSYRYKYNYVQIPFTIAYDFISNNAVKVYFTTGIDLNFLYSIGVKKIEEYSEENDSNYRYRYCPGSNYNQFSPSLNFSCGIDFLINQYGALSRFRIEPIVRCTTKQLLRSPQTSEYFCNYGLTIGLVF